MSDRKKQWESDVHRRLAEHMQEAFKEAAHHDCNDVDVDFSFLTEVTKGERRPRRFVRVAAVAAGLVIVLLGANLFILVNDEADSYGDKGILHRIQQGIYGIFTDEEEVAENDVKETLSISEEADLDVALEFLPELYLPGYVPAGYSFESLTIDEYFSGSFFAEYVLTGGEDREITIGLEYAEGDVEYASPGDGRFIEREDRKIYVAEDQVFGEVDVSVYLEDCLITISNAGDEETGILMADGMKKRSES